MNVKFLALFLLLPLFVHAGWIDSYSFDQPIGGNQHQLTLYSSPQVVNDGDAWRYFTKSKSYNFTWGYSGTTLQLNWTNQGRNLSVAFNKFCPVCSPYQVTDNGDKFDLWFNATIPAGAHGTYGFTFPSGFGNYWINDTTCFSGANLTFCYPDWNKNESDGSFNSTFSIWMNPVTRQIQTNITFACWTNSSCFETFDPVITQTSANDLYLKVATGARPAWTLTKFQLTSLPTNVTILYSALSLAFWGGGPSTYVMVPIYNGSQDWNYSDSPSFLALTLPRTPVGNSTNVSYDGARYANGTFKPNYWNNWNVTNATIFSYLSGKNLTLIINETSMTPFGVKTQDAFLRSGNDVCTDADCGITWNSSRAGMGNPHLDIIYQYNIPQWDSPGYNTTVQGQLTKMFVHWTGNSLGNYFFELDNGNGTNQNYTGAISGIDNWTNYTFYDNQGSNSTVHFRVYQTDSISGGMNVSPLTTFQITPITVKNQPSTVIMLSNTSNETFIYSLMVVIIAVALLLRRKGNSA